MRVTLRYRVMPMWLPQNTISPRDGTPQPFPHHAKHGEVLAHPAMPNITKCLSNPPTYPPYIKTSVWQWGIEGEKYHIESAHRVSF